ncbi:zinc-ribbon domain-containing protein [Dehalococcoidia bacterium]|nr:zinc-ribbon domain-containing protein [Dehalococcoidia bacterium]
MFEKITCSKCGVRSDPKSRFCSQCGSPLFSGSVCSNCGRSIEPEYKFCPGCGASSQFVEKREDPGKISTWQRGPNDFARRLEVSDVKGIFSKNITITSGTKAIVLQEGRFFGELPPGRYNVGGLISMIKNLNLAERATMILVDDADVGLNFNIGGLRTRENFDAGVRGKVVLNIEEPILFFQNLMKTREQILITDIEAMLRSELLNILQSKIKQYSFEELYGNLELKKEIEQDFRHHLGTTLSRSGLNLVYLSYFDYDESYWEAIRRERGEYARDEERETLADRRLDLTRRMRERLTADKINELQNAEDLEKFLHELDRGKVIQENEMVELKQIFEENRQDRAFARDLMLKRVEQRHALDMDAERRLHELEMERKSHELEMEQDREELDMGLKALRDLKAAKREDVAGYQELEIERMQKEAELEEQRLKVRSAASDEALISMVEGKQADHLTELARMKLATGLTDEQILALGARDSAAIAEAFKERYKSKSAEEIMSIYEDRLGDRDKMLKTIQEMADKGGDRIERLAAKALEQMGTTASTRAQTGGTTVVTGGQQGQPVIIGGTPSPPAQETKRVVICTGCNVELPVGTKFCTNCGATIAHRG